MPRFTYFAFVLSTLLVSILYPEHAESRKLSSDNSFPSPTGCLNCSVCQYPCHPFPAPPPPLPEYPIYGAPPPPSPISQYPPYGTSPPQANCTQFPSMNPPPYLYQPVGESYSASGLSLISVVLLAVCISVLL